MENRRDGSDRLLKNAHPLKVRCEPPRIESGAGLPDAVQDTPCIQPFLNSL
jgi:hypothetical protein